jgi:hypothetical protein
MNVSDLRGILFDSMERTEVFLKVMFTGNHLPAQSLDCVGFFARKIYRKFLRGLIWS